MDPRQPHTTRRTGQLLATPSSSQTRPSRRRNPLPCVHLLPLIILLTFLNKSILTPPSTTFIRVAGLSHAPVQPLPQLPHTQVNTLYNITIHPLSELLHTLITSRNQTSLLAYPCAQHTSITHPLLQLLQHTAHLPSFQYVCQDPDSRNLATAHASLSKTLPDYVATFRRGNFSNDQITADVLLSGAVQTPSVRALLLKARGVGVRFAVLRAPAMPGLPWTATDQPVTQFRPVFHDAPFPFAHALVAVSAAYGYAHEFVLVYDLTYLPKVAGVADLTRVQVARDLIRAKMRN